MDLSALEGEVLRFLDAGLAASTQRTYQSGWRRYLAFARAFSLPPSPLSHEKVTLFVAHLGAEGLSGSTIESYLAALRYMHLRANPGDLAPSFHSPFLKIVLKGIRRLRAHSDHPAGRIRLPITRHIMTQLKGQLALDSTSHTNRLVWAACCTGFFGFLRVGEFLVPDGVPYEPSTHLSLADVALHQTPPTWHFSVRIKVSKTDQFREGAQAILGATGAELCPVTALLDYLNIRGNQPGPLFCTPGGDPLTRAAFVAKVQAALASAGLDSSKFNSHSFRIGAATSASQAGVQDSAIKALGRWRSMAFQRYIRPSTSDIAALSSQLS